MVKFTFPLPKFLFVFLTLLLITTVSLSAVFVIPSEPVSFIDWLQINWAVVLLIISEALAMFPGKKSGILKIILFVLKRLVALKSSRFKS